MNEQQSAVHTRAQQTCAVWNQFAPTLEFGDLKLSDHQAHTAAIPGLELAVTNQQEEYDGAVAAVLENFAFLKDINTRFVKAVEGGCKKGDPCIDELADLRKVQQTARKKILDRAPLTISLWTKVNAKRATMVPVIAELKVGGTTLAQFTTKRNAHEGLVQTEKNEKSALTDAKQAFEGGIETLKVDNQRWLDGWLGEFGPGSSERDALSQIDMGNSDTPVPGQAVIEMINVLANRTVDLHFSALHGTKFKIEFKLLGAPSYTVLAEDWDQETFQNQVGAAGTYVYVVTPNNSTGTGPASEPAQIVVP